MRVATLKFYESLGRIFGGVFKSTCYAFGSQTGGTVFLVMHEILMLIFLIGWVILKEHLLISDEDRIMRKQKGFIGGSTYEGIHGAIGYYLHMLPGAVYFMSTMIQFIPGLRINYPKLHRVSGFVFYICAFWCFVGLIYLGFKGFTGGPFIIVSTVVGAIYWVYCTIESLRTAINRDIINHQIWNIRAVTFADSIITSRIAIGVFTIIVGAMRGVEGNELEGVGHELTFLFLVCNFIHVAGAEMFFYGRWNRGWFSTATNFASPAVTKYLSLVEDIKHSETCDYSKMSITSASSEPSSSKSKISLTMHLVGKTVIDSRTVILKFQTLDAENYHLIDIGAGGHVSLEAHIHGEVVVRSFTPLISDLETGCLTFLVRKQKGGVMSSYLNNLQLKQQITVIRNDLDFNFNPTRQNHHVYVAAGSGIAPIFPMIASLIANSNTATADVVYYPGSGSAVPLERQLLTLASKSSNRVRLLIFPSSDGIKKSDHHGTRESTVLVEVVPANTVEGGCGEIEMKPQQLRHEIGSVQHTDLQATLSAVLTSDHAKASNSVKRYPYDSHTGNRASVFVCGPLAFEQTVLKQAKATGYTRDLVWSFGIDGR